MDKSRKKHKIVYLIDVSLANCLECDHCNEILLTALRLLLFFRKAQKQKNTHNVRSKSGKSINARLTGNKLNFEDVKWGFKFFSSTTTVTRSGADNVGLKDVKFSCFTEFEKKLKETFAQLRSDSAKRRSLSHPAERLSTALTETLHDFVWNEDDVFTSPVTRKQVQHEKISRNIVFLFAKAPNTRKLLRQFSNKVVLDAEIFIDSIMSPALMAEYQQRMNISLYWIDFWSGHCKTPNVPVQNEVMDGSLRILDDGCRKLGGRLLNKDFILGQIPVSADGAYDLENFLTPLHILTSFPMESRLSDLPLNSTDKSDNIPAMITVSDSPGMAVSLTPVALGQKRRYISPQQNLGSETFGATNESAVDLFNYQQDRDLVEAHFILQGCVPFARVSDLIMNHSTSCYLLGAQENDMVSTLLQQLATSQTCGILNVRNKRRPFLALAVLQGQAQHMGFITVLNLEASVQVEKSWWQQSNTGFSEKGDHENAASSDSDKINKKETIMEKLNKELLQQKETKNVHHMKNCENTQVFNPQCLNSWHVPGTSAHMATLVGKICDRLDALDNLSKMDKNVLKQLQKLYAKEKQPTEMIQNILPSTSTPMCALRSMRVNSSGRLSNSGGSESGSRSSHGGLSHRLSSTLTRGRLMVDKARSASLLVAEDDNESFQSKPGSPEKRRSNSFGLTSLDLKTEKDLETYLQKQYHQVLSAGFAIGATIQTMITVTAQFMSNMQLSNPQKAAANFIQTHLVLTSAKLREKYLNITGKESKGNKIAEYKLQIMLLLELESQEREADTSKSGILNELVSMLRALSFTVGAMDLRDFLTDVIVANYSFTLPNLLVDVYDELMLPVPAALAKFTSPAAPSSIWGGPLSAANEDSLLSAPGSSQPPSNLSSHSSQQMRRSSNFMQHPSFSDFRQKKQILIKPKLKPKEEKKKVVKAKVKTKVSSSRPRRGGKCERAKRNLFSEKTKPSQSKVRGKAHTTSHRHRQNHRHSSKSRTLVLGTPAHKQTSQRHLQQQERRRRHENIKSEVQVIAESPAKDDDSDQPVSVMNKPARYIVRESFYSSKSQPSHNLARPLQRLQNKEGSSDPDRYLAKANRSQGTLASAVRGESPILSPQSRLLKSFILSPSPPAKSKSKHDRSVRKPVKKLVFKENEDIHLAVSNRSAGTEDVHLVFDGENANDFCLLMSPKKGGNTGEGYKTPEKQKVHSKPEAWETASCPPIIITPNKRVRGQSPKLNFSNILSQQGEDLHQHQHQETDNQIDL